MTAPIRRSGEGWKALLAALPEAMRAEVEAAYAAPARHYHDGAHVGGIWATWLALGGDARDRAILWAAAYHDLVYEIPAPKGWNEAESARRLAQAGAGLALDPGTLAEAIGMIAATADHLAATAPRDRLF
jgi:predicted metal-dependent HD superfamily phosphohydrolase